MMKAGVWGAIASVVLAGACAKSEPADGDWAAECIALRELEEAAEEQLWCGSETDDGPDGDVDARASAEYDEWGRIVVLKSDSDAYSERRYEYDADGLLLWRELYGQDGELAFREAHDYGSGSLIRDKLDLDGDGEVDVVSTYDYSCLADGEGDFDPTGRSACSVEHDIDNDGDVDRTSTKVRADDGTVLEAVEYVPATGATRTTSMDDEGGTRVEEDSDSDGTIDVVRGTQPIENGWREWRDEDADGTKDWWRDQTSSRDASLAVEYDRDGEISRTVSGGRDGVSRTSYRNARSPEEDYDAVTWLDALGQQRGSAYDERPFGSADSCSYALLCQEDRE